MKDEELLALLEKKWYGHLSSYVQGLIFSFILTVTAFLMVGLHIFPKPVRIGVLLFLALAQAAVQMHYFLHIGKDTKPHFRTLIFVFMIFVLLILVFGSLWIMANLNERVM